MPEHVKLRQKTLSGHHSGHQEKALANRGSACRERDERMTNLAIDPEFDLLRSDLANFGRASGNPRPKDRPLLREPLALNHRSAAFARRSLSKYEPHAPL